MLRTVSDGIQNGGDVDNGLVIGADLSPPLPVFKSLSRHVLLRDAAQQHHHSVWRVKESMHRSVQFRLIEHVQKGRGEQHHDAFTTLEVVEVVPVELIGRAHRVQQDRPLAELFAAFQDLLQIRGPLLRLGRMQD